MRYGFDQGFLLFFEWGSMLLESFADLCHVLLFVPADEYLIDVLRLVLFWVPIDGIEVIASYFLSSFGFDVPLGIWIASFLVEIAIIVVIVRFVLNLVVAIKDVIL